MWWKRLIRKKIFFDVRQTMIAAMKLTEPRQREVVRKLSASISLSPTTRFRARSTQHCLGVRAAGLMLRAPVHDGFDHARREARLPDVVAAFEHDEFLRSARSVENVTRILDWHDRVSGAVDQQP